MTLRDLLDSTRRAIRQVLPQEVWIEATVLKVRHGRAGHQLELVETHAEDPARCARLSCFLSGKVLGAIREEFGFELDPATLEGSCALLKLSLSFHPHYHLQGQVTGLSPALSEDQFRKALEATRRALKDAGLFDAQSRLTAPADILRLAVIHPVGSAGWADVHPELERLTRHGLLEVISIPATFEGAGARASLCAALAQVASLAGEGLDLVLIVRGGGAAAGLRVLSHADVAWAICRLPVPVVTGLGHATDRSLLDEVAWRSADTPSKAAALVIQMIRDRADSAARDYRDIQDNLQRHLSHQFQMLEQIRQDLCRDVQAILAQAIAMTRSNHQVAQTWRATLRLELSHLQGELELCYDELMHGSHALPRRQRRELGERYRHLLTGFHARCAALDDADTRASTLRSAGHHLLARQRQALESHYREVLQLMKRSCSEASHRLDALQRESKALSVQSTLERGFAIALDPQRRMLTRVSAVRSSPFTLILADGAVAATAEGLS
ncbi:exodeoxyribonuclease VII large subunit [Microvirga sp. 0TCS3.31]